MKSTADIAIVRSPFAHNFQIAADLAKIRLSSLVLVTVAVGWMAAYLSGFGAGASALSLVGALVGVLATAAGSAAINQVIERDLDARMHRTRERPIPSGRISADGALVGGMLSMLVGLMLLLLLSGALATLLALASALIYIAIYTPLKRITTLNTIVGAVSGALPPMIGWAAATQKVDVNALALFGILFVWQIPHFLAIAWLHRDDYARADMAMLGVVDPDGSITMRQILLFGLAMVPVSLVPSATGLCGLGYAIAAAILGLLFLGYGVRLIRSKSREDARKLFYASLLYLPALLAAMLIDIGIA